MKYLALFILLCPGVYAADHADAPEVIKNLNLDLLDLFLFRSPNDSDNAVLILTVNANEPGSVADKDLFDDTGKYVVYVDRDADLVADFELHFFLDLFNKNFAVYVGTTAYAGAFGEVKEEGGVKVFAGARDDPAFMDFEGTTAFFASGCASDDGFSGTGVRCANTGSPENFYEAFNVGVLAIELPVTTLTGGASASEGTIKVWAKSFKRVSE